ncbi:C1q and tumor necrosis factor-related protein-like protein 3 isoform b [Daphnia sinensis]|uniref:C1q and tumor necrosis factor-related protein-like protein 3 isoform b n=1 Tax=Daphnia sinensis TaxID=1820382 RepID=A0AAD5PV71_9CRUS|nr:C1q and tumor necrosis factor-related protein-like protein 3 isoform b [Daphnia sinensis]
MPTSCDDLRTLGNVMSGFYNIKSSTKVATQVIGNADVKSTAVYFYVKLANDEPADLKKIPFEDVKLNVGNSMDATSGTFTAPVNGTYFFSYTGAIVYFGDHPDLVSYVVSLLVNEEIVAEGVTDETGIQNTQYNPVHLEATLNLNKGDTIG